MKAVPPRLFTIPPDVPFLKAMAAAILAGGFPTEKIAPPEALDLPKWTIYLPTRRAARALTQAFLELQAGSARLLPRIRSFGDVDEDELAFADPAASDDLADLPPAISPLERQFLLARLINDWAQNHQDQDLAQSLLQAPGTSLSMAQSLARLMDNFEMEELPFSRLDELFGPEYPEHREALLGLLAILRDDLPRKLEELGLMGQGARRSQIIRQEAKRLALENPTAPVIAAGSTGSIPATAELLRVIAGLPQGAVILPGLDLGLDEKAWQLLERPDQQHHPQWGLYQLLVRLGASRDDVKPLPHMARQAYGPAREFILSEIMRPSAATDKWADAVRGREDDVRLGLSGIHFMHSADSRQEALAIALRLREVLQHEGKTAALITPDRNLARRVKAELSRWQIELDDTAGEPLARSLEASFFRLLLEAAQSHLSPQALMGLLRHPLTRCNAASAMDLIFRGKRLPDELSQLSVFLKRQAEKSSEKKHLPIPLKRLSPENWQDTIIEADRIIACLEPLSQKSHGSFDLEEWIDAHIKAANQLAGEEALWNNEAGELLANLFQLMRQAAISAPKLSLTDYLGLVVAQIAATPMRTLIPSHPRLAVYGLLEARLVSADVMILGGLNENIWPEEAEIDPWLSRPMKRNLGLMQPERRLGLTAHDFVQAFSGKEIWLSASHKRNGSPVVSSRWILRLEALLQAANLAAIFKPDAYWPGLALGLDSNMSGNAISPPMPRPSVHLRPKKISVTEAEKLITDPYAYYARHILALEPLPPLGPTQGAAEKGTLWHDILESFTSLHNGELGANALAKLIQIAQEKFAAAKYHMDVHPFWWPQFIRAAQWFIEQETRLRQDIKTQFSEVRGEIKFDIEGQSFTLSGRADRLDQRQDQQLRILDYKTGDPPSKKDFETGKAPQLPLEAYIATHGGFKETGKAPSFELAVMKLSGGYPAGNLLQYDRDVPQIAELNFNNLCSLLAAYMQEAQAYLPMAEDKKYEDYDHLARYLEWQAGLTGEVADA